MNLAAEHNFALRAPEDIEQVRVVRRVHDVAHRRLPRQRVAAARPELPVRLLQALDERAHPVLRDERVVGRDTQLPGVLDFAVPDTFRDEVEVRDVVRHDRRALPTELERDRSQVPPRGACDDAPHTAVAGVEDVVPAERERVRRLGDAALYDRVRASVEILGEETRE